MSQVLTKTNVHTRALLGVGVIRRGVPSRSPGREPVTRGGSASIQPRAIGVVAPKGKAADWTGGSFLGRGVGSTTSSVPLTVTIRHQVDGRLVEV